MQRGFDRNKFRPDLMPTDRDLLKAVSLAAEAALRLSSLRGIVNIQNRATQDSDNTGGWFRTVATIPPDRLFLEIWVDRWSGSGPRALWYGVSTRNGEVLQRVAKRLARHLGAALERGDDDVAARGFARALTEDEFGRPVLELYRGQYNFYGIYLFPKDARFGSGPARCKLSAHK